MSPTLLLLGNANVGKSALFGALTGTYVTVSNYPGTTVELSEGRMDVQGVAHRVVDTPGIASLLPASEDERVTRDVVLSAQGASAVVVADAKNLERAVVLVLELGELGVPTVLCLNMVDEAAERGLRFDEADLSRSLGVPVVSTVAILKRGVRDLKAAVGSARPCPVCVDYGPGDASPFEDADCRIVRARHAAAAPLVAAARRETPVRSIGRALRERLDRGTTHRFWGWPILAAVLAALYLFVGRFGAGTLVDLFEDGLFGRVLNPAAVRAAAVLPWAFARDLLVGPYGVVTMGLTYALALVLPIVSTFFIAFGILEDSGYVPRLAVMVNRAFRAMGVSGKAVLPMVLGLGCGTMATLTTRVLETRRERLIVILLLALGVPCSAQLAVVLGLLRPLPLGGLLLWTAVVLLSLFLVGRLAATLIPGRPADFILELPPLRVPRLANVGAKTLARVEWYVREAVPLFVLGTLVLFVGDRLGLLALVQRAGEPVVVGLLGLPPAATEALVVGFLRRDFGAAGLFRLAEQGALSNAQVIVASVTITLLLPCIAQFFMILKERGLRTALAVAAFVIPFAVGAGALVRAALAAFPGALR